MPDHRKRTKLLISAVIFSAVLIAAALAQRENRLAENTPEQPRATGYSERSRATFGTDQAAVRAEVEPVRTEPEATPVKPQAPEPAPVEAAPVPQQPQEQPATAVEIKKEIPGDILGFIERWRATFNSDSLQDHVETYAPRMERFFNRASVSRDAVFAEKRRTLKMYPDVNKYEIHDMKLEYLRDDRAAVTFRKDWDLSGAERFAGSERARLGLRRLSQGWQIVREEELKVYWVRR
jgi:hypothetical protein